MQDEALEYRAAARVAGCRGCLIHTRGCTHAHTQPTLSTLLRSPAGAKVGVFEGPIGAELSDKGRWMENDKFGVVVQQKGYIFGSSWFWAVSKGKLFPSDQ